jgi:hypothetical protein
MTFTELDEYIQPWDSDHTALVHVLWAACHKGLTIDDTDELASFIKRSKWMRAVHCHASKRDDLLNEVQRLRAALIDIATEANEGGVFHPGVVGDAEERNAFVVNMAHAALKIGEDLVT